LIDTVTADVIYFGKGSNERSIKIQERRRDLKEVLLGNEVRPDLVNEQGLSLIGWSDLLKSHN